MLKNGHICTVYKREILRKNWIWKNNGLVFKNRLKSDILWFYHDITQYIRLQMKDTPTLLNRENLAKWYV